MERYILLYGPDSKSQQVWAVYGDKTLALGAADILSAASPEALVCVYELGELVETL